MPRAKPLIGIPADRRILGPHPFHCVGEKYIAALEKLGDSGSAKIVVMPADLQETLRGLVGRLGARG